MDGPEASQPNQMPAHFFLGETSVRLDYTSTQQADTSKQNFSVMPRHWYIEAHVTCKSCDEPFLFSVDEQKTWYEDYGFYVDSFPVRCPACRKTSREVKRLRQEYDGKIAAALTEPQIELKQHIVKVIDLLVATGLEIPPLTLQRKASLIGQIRKIDESKA